MGTPRPLSPVFVLGRFPPPMDGQTLATERCASFLETAFRVTRVNTQAPGADPLTANPTFSVRRTLHYVMLRNRVRTATASHPGAPILWHSISPARLGHLRDVLTTISAFPPRHPVIGVLHRAGFDALFRSPVTSTTAVRLVRRLDAVVFQSRALANRCADAIPSHKRRIIPNTVRDEVIPTVEEVEVRRQRGLNSPLQVLFLSNMLPEKGYADVLEAIGALRRRGLSVHTTFAGNWPSEHARRSFSEQARHLGVEGDIEILGGVSDVSTVRRLHLAADVLVLPTTHPTETQPIAILEALGAGTPVVTIDRPVMRDILTDGVEGALVPPHAPDAIADAIERLAIPDRWQATSEAARARFDAAFSPHVVGERWRALAEEFEAR